MTKYFALMFVSLVALCMALVIMVFMAKRPADPVEIGHMSQEQFDQLMERFEQHYVRLEYNRGHDNNCYSPPGIDTAPHTVDNGMARD